jgi:hypothetical protein
LLAGQEHGRTIPLADIRQGEENMGFVVRLIGFPQREAHGWL